MRKLILTALSAGMIGLFAGGAQAATPASEAPSAPTIQKPVQTKVIDHRRGHRYDRRGYRDQRYNRRNHRDQRYSRGRSHRQNCWRENQRTRFRGRGAIVSVRVCEGRRGFTYTVDGSERFVRYIGPRHRNRHRGHRR